MNLSETVEALATGQVTSATLVDRAVEQAIATESTLNAFRCVRADAARAEAAQADARLAAGERLPLLGVPVAIKDDTDIAGESTPFGCAGEFPVAEADGEVTRRLHEAGAVIVGKTTTPEVGQWPIAEGIAFGITRNPWDLDRTPGGSSGGSAAAVAAGIVPAAMGSDGAGSVRIPAAWTGLVGLKPQRGRVSMWPDADAFNGLTCFGPLARTVRDAALLLDVVAGQHPQDRHIPPAPSGTFVEAAERDPGRLRIAVSYGAPFSGVPIRLHPEIRAAVSRLAGVLRELGHDVFEEEIKYGAVGPTLVPRGISGVSDWARAHVTDRSQLDPRTQEALRTARVLRPLVPIARRAEGLVQRRIGAIFRRADVVLSPTSAKPPLRVGAFDGLSGFATDRAMTRACPYAYPWNVTGWPGLNVPAGLTERGLPIGAQLLGPEASEELLLSLGAQLESVERWAERRPPA